MDLSKLVSAFVLMEVDSLSAGQGGGIIRSPCVSAAKTIGWDFRGIVKLKVALLVKFSPISARGTV